MSNKSKIQSAKIGAITQKTDKNSVAPLSELTYSSGVVYNTNPAPPITKVNRTFQSDSGTVVVETDKDVYVNTVENIVEQKYINNVTAGALDVGTVSGTDYTNVASGIYKLGFDTDSGFDVTDLGAGVAKIAMNSTFKYWNVDGSPGLIACGLDTVNFVAGSGVTITSCNSAVPKTLTISSTAGASPATPTNLGTVFGCTNSTNYNTAVGYCSGNLFNSSNVCNSVALGQCALASSSYGCNNIAIGNFSLSKQTEGSCNIAIGYGSLCCLATGYGNIAVGQLAMRNATNADTNIMIGRAAGAYMPASAAPYGNIGLGVRAFTCSGASYSIGLGSETMYYTNGYGHVALGNYALFNASGDENVAIGVSSMSCVTNASSNTAVGTNSMIGRGNSDACLNTAMGYEAMSSYCTAIHNVAIGSFAMGDARGSLTQNVAVGDYSLLRMRDGGANNSALGYCSLYCVSTGNTNIGIGYCAGACITTGSNNTVIGSLTGTAGLVCTVLIGAGTCERIKVDNSGLYINGACWCSGAAASPATPTSLGTTYAYNQTALCNTFVGYCAGNTSSTGTSNVAIGRNALINNTTGNNNVAIGNNALYSQPGNSYGYGNIAIGKDALYSNLTGYGNVAIGDCAMYMYNSPYGWGNVGIGYEALKCNTSGLANTAIGYGSMSRGTGDFKDNVGLGTRALKYLSSGCGNVATGASALFNLTSGCYNIAVGTGALQELTNANDNIAIGEHALWLLNNGNNNISIGCLSGCSITTGNNNTVIGALAGTPGLVCTVLIGAGTCERIKVDNTGLYINGVSVNASPGGCNTQFQYNSSGAFAGACGLTYDSATCSVGMTKITVPQNQSLQINVSNPNTYWYSLYGEFSTGARDDYSSQAVYDSNGNIYFIGANGDDGIPHLVKYNSAGTLIWQKVFNEPTNDYNTGDTIAIDSSNNVYCTVGRDDNYNDVTIFKFDSSGNVIWQTNISGDPPSSFDPYIACTDIIVDVSGNVYACLYYSSTVDSQALVKLNSSGAVQWQKVISGNGRGYPQGLALDSAGNVIMLGQYSMTGSSNDDNLLLSKINSSGTILWQKRYSNPYGASLRVGTGQITTDSSNNIYVTGVLFNNLTYYNSYVAKLDLNGNLIWQRNFTNTVSGKNIYSGGVTLDSSNNIYIGGTISTAKLGIDDLYSIKLNNSGVVQWQRIISGNNDDDYYYYWSTKTIDVYNQYYMFNGYTSTGSTGSNDEAFVIQLPIDGSLSGSYGLFTYESVNLTSDTLAFTSAVVTNPSTNGVLVSSTGVYTVTNGSNEHYLYKISGGNNTFTISDTGYFSLPGYTLPLVNGPTGSVLTADISGNTNWTTIPPLSLDNYCSLQITASTSSVVGYGCNNFSVGFEALQCTYNWVTNNTAIGYRALATNFGFGNLAIGCNAMSCNQNGNCNIALGDNALANTVDGNTLNNVAIGANAMRYACNSANNIALGYNTLNYITCDGYNTIAIGDGSNFCRVSGDNNTGIGVRALAYAVSGWQNIAIGYESQYSNGHGGAGNIGVGYFTLKNVGVAYDNIAIGGHSQCARVGGNHNISLGYGTLRYNTVGGDNVAIGADSQRCNICGGENIALGSRSLYNNTTGGRNIAIGIYPLYRNISGIGNIAMGIGALEFNCTGSYSVAIGEFAAQNNKESQIVAIGDSALARNTTGSQNVAVGSNALRENTTGVRNVAVGNVALLNNTTGYDNVAVGASSLRNNTNGYVNIGIGTSALEQNTCGNNNIAIGPGSLYCNTGGACNLAIGTSALNRNVFGTGNVAIGVCSLSQNCGAVHNIGLGMYSLTCNISGSANLAIGSFAMLTNNCGSRNIALGCYSLHSLITGCDNIAIGPYSSSNMQGSRNIAIGLETAQGQILQQATENVVIGYHAAKNISGNRNIAIGTYASCNDLGNCNTVIGWAAGPISAGSCGTNNITLGYCATPQTDNSSNTITLGNSSITCIRAQVTSISTLSDQRDKTNVQDLPLGLQFILDLRPVKFTWNMRDGGKVGVDDTGFIAQEVLSIEDKYDVSQYLDMVGRENPDKLELKPAKLIPILVRAIQELNEVVAAQGVEIQKLKDRLSNI